MSNDTLNLFKEIYEKQSELSKLTNLELFSEYSNSEVHVVDIIGSSDDINGVLISDKLGITRGAVSKIISKLNKKGLIETYKKENNKKEIYYNLTVEGLKVYNEHKKAHIDWEEREKIFFDSIDKEEIQILDTILDNYNHYLGKLIVERSE